MDVGRLQRGFELIAPDRAERAGTLQRSLGLLDHRPVPSSRILIAKRNVFAVFAATGAAPGLRVQHGREETQSLRLRRHQLGDEPGQEQRLLGEVTPDRVRRARIAPTFGEGGIDRGQDRVQPVPQLLALGIQTECRPRIFSWRTSRFPMAAGT